MTDKKLIPFDLDRVLAGDEAITESGLSAKLLFTSKKKQDQTLFFLIDMGDKEDVIRVTLDGRIYSNGGKSNFDLYMAPKTKTYFANIFKVTGNVPIDSTSLGGHIFHSKEKADSCKELSHIKTISFEIEE